MILKVWAPTRSMLFRAPIRRVGAVPHTLTPGHTSQLVFNVDRIWLMYEHYYLACRLTGHKFLFDRLKSKFSGQ
jgi:hypothetical protein